MIFSWLSVGICSWDMTLGPLCSNSVHIFTTRYKFPCDSVNFNFSLSLWFIVVNCGYFYFRWDFEIFIFRFSVQFCFSERIFMQFWLPWFFVFIVGNCGSLRSIAGTFGKHKILRYQILESKIDPSKLHYESPLFSFFTHFPDYSIGFTVLVRGSS